MGSSVAIVIPCYNEAKRLKVSKFKVYSDADRSHLFVFVNDGSNDATLKVYARPPQRSSASLLIYRSAEESRQGRSCQAGFIVCL